MYEYLAGVEAHSHQSKGGFSRSSAMPLANARGSEIFGSF